MTTVRLLGEVEVVDDGGEVVHLSGRMPRLLLALLAIHTERGASPEELIDGMWDGEPPPSASSALRVHMSSVRRTLNDAGCKKEAVVRTAVGYALDRAVVAVDTDDLDDGLRSARRLPVGRAARCVEIAQSLLERWKGRPFGDLGSNPVLAPHVARLEGLRLDIAEVLADAQLRIGRYGPAISMLEPLVTENPYRERLVAQLVVAFYRAGRQVDALATFQTARRRLVEDLGLEPCRELLDLEVAVLRQDAALVVPFGTAVGGGSTTRRPLPPSLVRSAGGQFVGRAAEVSAMEERAADQLATSQSRPLLAVGQPGIGKTRLLAEVTERLADGFQLVLHGWGEPDGDPYHPWRTALRQLSAGIGTSAALQRFHALTSVGATPGTQMLVNEATMAVVDELTDGQAVLLVFDDLQWFDSASLQLFLHVARNAPRGLVSLLAARDPDADGWPSALDHVMSTLQADELELEGLSVDDINELLVWSYGVAPSVARRLALRLSSLTGGNPLFVEAAVAHLLPALAGESSPAVAFDSLGLPRTVTGVMTRRLDALDQDARGLLEVASILGFRFSPLILQSLGGAGSRPVRPALSRCIAERLLIEESPSTTRFSHEMLRTVVQGAIPDERRHVLHRQVAEALRDRQPGSPSIQVAMHMCRAVPEVPASEAVEAALEAAEATRRMSGFEDAAQMFRLAFELAEQWGLGSQASVDALIGLGRSLASAGARREAIAAFEDAVAIAERVADPDSAARIGRAAAETAREMSVADAAGAVIHRAYAVARQGDGPVSAQFAIDIVIHDCVSGGWSDEVDRLADAAWAGCRRLGEAEEFGRTILSMFSLYGTPDATGRLELSERLVSYGEVSGWDNEFVDRVARQVGLVALLELGRFDEALVAVERIQAGEGARRYPILRWLAEATRANIALARGDIAAADASSNAALQMGLEWEIGDAFAIYAAQLLGRAFVVDGLGALVDLMSGVQRTPTTRSLLDAAAGLAYDDAGDDAAAAAATRQAVDLLDVAPRSTLIPGTVLLAAQGAVDQEAVDLAPTLLDRLRPFAGQWPQMGVGGWTLGPTNRVLGRLESLVGSPDRAIESALRAVDDSERASAAPWTAWCYFDLAVIQDRVGNRGAADDALLSADALARKFALERLSRKIGALEAARRSAPA